MKRMFLIVLAMCICLSGFGCAEGIEVFNGFELLPDEPVSIDLNGDGAEEIFEWHIIFDEYGYEDAIELIVIRDGTPTSVKYGTIFNVHVYISDIDSNEKYEIFFCGDEASDDYVTLCMEYTGYGIMPMLVADAGRSQENSGYYSIGYGYIASIADGTLTLSGSQDILGTRFGTRSYGLQDGRFELVDDGMWHFDYQYFEDDELWEYAAISPVMDIPAMFMENGDEYEGAIKAGEKILITASDKVSVVYFRMQDGRQGYFFVTPDDSEYGWGHYINGVYESEVFEFLPYAD